jgi:molybdate transport system permease protein
LGFDLSPMWISLKTASVATLVTFLLGILAAWFMVNARTRFKGLIDGIFTLPLVLPPTVLGFFLLLIFGKNGPIGRMLYNLGTTVIFTWQATVISASIVAFPLMYKTVKASFEQIDRDILNAARTLGASEWKVFWKVTFPISWPGIAAGTILAFARALGEFGATLMIAGNIPGKTQTIPIAIYFAVEGGEMTKALIWVLLIFTISLASIVIMNYWTNRKYRIFSLIGR